MESVLKTISMASIAVAMMLSMQPAMAQFVGGVAAPGAKVEAAPPVEDVTTKAPAPQTVLPKIKEYQQDKPVWDSTSAFGPVPKNLQKVGNAECKKAKFDRAVGYSEGAQNPDGSDFEKGGFLCESDSKKSS